MKTKFFFIGILFAALTFTACGDKLNVEDPNPHCYKVSYVIETGATMVDYYWVTDKELQDEILPAIMNDHVTIPVYEKVEAKDRGECAAYKEEEPVPPVPSEDWLSGRYVCQIEGAVASGYVCFTFNENKFNYEEVVYGSSINPSASGTYTIKDNQLTFTVEEVNPEGAEAALAFGATINDARDVLTVGELEFHLDLR